MTLGIRLRIESHRRTHTNVSEPCVIPAPMWTARLCLSGCVVRGCLWSVGCATHSPTHMGGTVHTFIFLRIRLNPSSKLYTMFIPMALSPPNREFLYKGIKKWFPSKLCYSPLPLSHCGVVWYGECGMVRYKRN